VTKYNFTGGIQAGEIVQNNKAYKDDEMYDGGDDEAEGEGEALNKAEGMENTLDSTLDSKEIFLDLD